MEHGRGIFPRGAIGLCPVSTVFPLSALGLCEQRRKARRLEQRPSNLP